MTNIIKNELTDIKPLSEALQNNDTITHFYIDLRLALNYLSKPYFIGIMINYL
jgi:hypothetical protein